MLNRFEEATAYSQAALIALREKEAQQFQMSAEASTLAAPSAELIEALVGFPTASGKIVTRETSLRIAAFLSALKILSGDLAKLPLILRENKTVKGRQTSSPAVDNQLYDILKNVFNTYQTSYQAKFYLASQLISTGNAFAQILRDQRGRITELWPLDSFHMQAKWDLSKPGAPILFWHYSDGRGNLRTFWPAGTHGGIDEVWHSTSGNFEGNGLVGSRLIVLAKEALSVLAAAEEASGRTFANSMAMSGFITAPQGSEITEEQGQKVVDSLKRNMSGPQNAGKFTLLPNDLKFVPMQWSAKDSQLLESRAFNEIAVVRAMGGQPLLNKLGMGDKRDNASSSAFLEDYWSTCLMPHAVAFEQSAHRDLLTKEERKTFYIKFDANVVLRGSLRERTETAEIAIRSGQKTPNEVRVEEDRDCIDGFGDCSFFPQNGAVFDPSTGAYFIPGQAVPADNADETSPPTDPNKDVSQGGEGDAEVPPVPQPKKKGKKLPPKTSNATARLQLLAKGLVERIERSNSKAPVTAKFVSEVLSCSMVDAETYVAAHHDHEFNEDSRAALLMLAIGETNEDSQ